MLYGVSVRSQTPVILDPFDQLLDNANMVVAAPAGSGKSFFVKLMAMRNLCAGTDFVVIDPEDEYRAVAAAAGGLVIRLAASSSHRLNPFDLPPPGPPLPTAAVDPLDTPGDEEDPLAERITALLVGFLSDQQVAPPSNESERLAVLLGVGDDRRADGHHRPRPVPVPRIDDDVTVKQARRYAGCLVVVDPRADLDLAEVRRREGTEGAGDARGRRALFGHVQFAASRSGCRCSRRARYQGNRTDYRHHF
jgi:hypothetical protein